MLYVIGFTLFYLSLIKSLSSSKRGNLLAFLVFDDDYTLYKQMYFKRLYAGQYPVVTKIVDSTYDLVYERVLVKRIQRS